MLMTLAAPTAWSTHELIPSALLPTAVATVRAMPVPATFSCSRSSAATSTRSQNSVRTSTCRASASRRRLNMTSARKLRFWNSSPTCRIPSCLTTLTPLTASDRAYSSHVCTECPMCERIAALTSSA